MYQQTPLSIFSFLQYFTMKVICDSIGKCHLCDGCGAAKPHLHDYCEPCPVVADAKCVEVVFEDSSLDFEEDFKNENGNYQNYCCFCEQTFLGYKHRRICKRCSAQFYKTIKPKFFNFDEMKVFGQNSVRTIKPFNF